MFFPPTTGGGRLGLPTVWGGRLARSASRVGRPELPTTLAEDHVTEGVRDVVVLVGHVERGGMAVPIRLARRDLAQVVVGDLALGVRDLQELLPCGFRLAVGELDAKQAQAVVERV